MSFESLHRNHRLDVDSLVWLLGHYSVQGRQKDGPKREPWFDDPAKVLSGGRILPTLSPTKGGLAQHPSGGTKCLAGRGGGGGLPFGALFQRLGPPGFGNQ